MNIEKTKFKGLLILRSTVHSDRRGFFKEINKKKIFKKDLIFDCLSHSKKNTIRGLHFQKKPFAQKKLISVVNTIINNSIIAPIIILQGDHGPFSNHRSGNIIYDNYTTVDNIRERMGIMNMYLVI